MTSGVVTLETMAMISRRMVPFFSSLKDPVLLQRNVAVRNLTAWGLQLYSNSGGEIFN